MWGSQLELNQQPMVMTTALPLSHVNGPMIFSLMTDLSVFFQLFKLESLVLDLWIAWKLINVWKLGNILLFLARLESTWKRFCERFWLWRKLDPSNEKKINAWWSWPSNTDVKHNWKIYMEGLIITQVMTKWNWCRLFEHFPWCLYAVDVKGMC